MLSPDDGLAKLRDLVQIVWPKLSEADTRAKLIDPLFRDCLGWDEKDIAREEHVHDGYVDYIFSSDGMNFLAIEAKKSGMAFEIPKTLSGRRYKINGVISEEKTLLASIEQAQSYCVEKGIRFGVVANGNQYVIFEAFRYNASWRDGKCVVYNSLEEIIGNFPSFWNLLSKSAVLEGSLKSGLSDQAELYTFTRPLAKFHNKDETLIRNTLYRYMQPFAEFFFSELTDDAKIELLRECYAHEKAHTDAENALHNYFLDRVKQLREAFDVKSFVESTGSAGRFEEAFEHSEELLHEKTPQGKLILLLGGIGAGKTTFLHRFFKVVLENRDDLIWFYVDCREAPIEPDKIETYIFKEVLRNFKEKYATKLSGIVTSAKLSELQPTYKDMVLLFAVLRANGYSTTLMLDNVDQQGYVSPILQEQIFLEAQSLTKSLRVVLILSLREETYFKSSTRGVLDAYYVEKFGIPPPYFKRMIELRLDYAVTLLESSSEKIVDLMKIEPPDEPHRKLLVAFLKIVKESIGYTGPASKSISNFINSISKGNMRQALEFFYDFLVSGNTNVEEMLGLYFKTGSYKIPYHGFLKSVILGDRKFYSSDSSFVMNLFDVNTNYSNSHFVAIRVLKYGFDRMQTSASAGRGMVEISQLLAEAEKIGMSLQGVRDTLDRLFRFKLVDFDAGKQTSVEASYFVVTPTGDYYLNVLTERFVYLDLVWQDTPMSDDKVADALRRLANSKDVNERFERVEIFLDYLARWEEKEFQENPEYAASALASPRFMPRITEAFGREREYIIRKRTRNTDESGGIEDLVFPEKSYWE